MKPHWRLGFSIRICVVVVSGGGGGTTGEIDKMRRKETIEKVAMERCI
jgi:hypothetical protein